MADNQGKKRPQSDASATETENRSVQNAPSASPPKRPPRTARGAPPTRRRGAGRRSRRAGSGPAPATTRRTASPAGRGRRSPCRARWRARQAGASSWRGVPQPRQHTIENANLLHQPGSVGAAVAARPPRTVRACLPALPVRAAPFPKAWKARSGSAGRRPREGTVKAAVWPEAAWRFLVGCDARRVDGARL